MPLLVVYAGVAALAYTLSIVRSEATLVRGSWVLALNAFFLAVETMRLMRAPGGTFSPALVVFGIATATSFLLREWWLVNEYDPDATRDVLERSMRQLRIEHFRDGAGYAIRAGSTSGLILIRPLSARHALMQITADTPSPKVHLLRKLLVKRFGRLVPRPHIRLR